MGRKLNCEKKRYFNKKLSCFAETKKGGQGGVLTKSRVIIDRRLLIKLKKEGAFNKNAVFINKNGAS